MSAPPSQAPQGKGPVSSRPQSLITSAGAAVSLPEHGSALLWTLSWGLGVGGVLTLLDAAFALRPWLGAVASVLSVLAFPMWARAALLLLKLEAEELQRGKIRIGRAAPYLVLAAIGVLLAAALATKVWVVWLAFASPDTGSLATSYRASSVSAFALAALGLLGRPRRLARILARVAEHHARLMVTTFGAAALLGAFLLTLPTALRGGAHTTFIDALFTAVSALCVTGLAVNTISETYTFFGQAVILVLIQVGGVGIMVLYSFFGVLAGRRMRVHHTAVMAEMLDVQSLASLRKALGGIIALTLLVEGIGTAVLYAAFSEHPDIALGPEHGGPLAGSGSVLWAAVFHSISAYCNAGFSLFPAGLMPFVSSPLVCGSVMTLVILGGLGFPVCFELLRAAWGRLRRVRMPRLSLHTRIVLVTSALLVLIGGLGTALLEGHNALLEHGVGTRLLASFFHSVVTRTAGFNTFDIGALGPAMLLLTAALMFVGGSPGSTAGGIKTTTLAVLLATFRGELRNEARVNLGGRSLSTSTTRRAVGVAFLSVAFLLVLLFVLLMVERAAPHALAFEVVSALATVGLSTGITADLSAPGKLVIVVAMFVGRIGPLTLALLLEKPAQRGHIEYPEEHIGIG